MGEVSIITKVFVEDPSKLEEVENAIKSRMKVVDSKIENIGFGVKLLKVMIIVSDKEGGDIEEKIKEIEGVSEVQVEDITLI